jgi:hypothetical protein
VNLDLLVTTLLGAGGAGLLAAVYRVVQSWRTDKASNEGTLIERLDARLKDAEARCDRLSRERDADRERAMRFRLLAVAKGATQDELREAGAVNGRS